MLINEIFKSIQGESSFAGFPCSFIRVTGCNLRCSYCDTRYAYFEGKEMSIDQIVEEVKKLKCPLVEITGGEPLLNEEVYPLIDKLLAENFQLLLETNGSLDISRVDGRVARIVDIKCPSSGMSHKMYWDNIKHLRHSDEVKFVIGSRLDYVWCREIIEKYQLQKRAKISLSLMYGKLKPEKLAGWMLADNLPARLQIQLHKYIWPGRERGV